MLTNTFCHVPGIGKGSELKLWEEGYRCWDDCEEIVGAGLSRKKAETIVGHIEMSRDALREGDPRFFAETLPSSESWRLFPEFRKRVAYVDIETTGLSEFGDHITTIALYDGREIRTYIHGENLQSFKDEIDDYDVLVTYNGKCFDIPFIERYFRISLEQPQIDLRYVLASLGIKGGLKGCERTLGLDRGDLDGVDGFMAVMLWNDYKRYGDERSLETLLAYNIQDVLSLEHLMTIAYNMKLEETPFDGERTLPEVTSQPDPGVVADRETVEKMRRLITPPAW